ncbi:fimbria/pilus outer membrane usher protein [Affinibrenneria salicis]|uniref:Fimbria/pilus outer membrane usher protein n=1 Tax=Affinibrenneria salicis TaxID=2590031 RepID=A0A5J5FV64_9GAMM|nr:fimbria/pilus outer membrane usher protein [Affinibrenneria salicis]KAA8997634.1 fimbria/pilus outer membrane usher protein [Affinibrenneria salicis]
MMKLLPKERIKRVKGLSIYGIFIVSFYPAVGYATEFNASVLDTDEQNTIDLTRFSDPDYVIPGDYVLTIKVNAKTIEQRQVRYLPAGPEGQRSVLCLDPATVEKFALKAEAKERIVWRQEGQCADLTAIGGVKISNQIGMGDLNVTIPQAWLKYSDSDWTPPEQWDNGINGVLLDYNLVGNVRRSVHGGDMSHYLSSYGTAGFNLGAWRYRADYRYLLNKTTDYSRDSFAWDQFYAYRPLPFMSADLKLGEMYLNSNLFDSYRFTGVSLASNENMLPPALRGYAPEIRGVARSNATVTVMQNQRVLYETTVPAGPFAIQDLKSGVTGTLEVTVTEEDGSVSTFQTEAASLPYLTRPGRVQYKLSAGRPSNSDRHIQGPAFSAGEFSWGMSNAWSLYGGSTLSDDYQSWSVGLGRNLYLFGAFSADITQSRARLPQEAARQGHSFSLNWSKRFAAINGQVSFAGYRFSEKGYMSMSQYLYALNNQSFYRSEKERYTVTLSKNFDSESPLLDGMSTYLSYTRQTFWDARQQNRYGLSLNKYLDIGALQGVSASLSAWRTLYNNRTDDSLYLNLSIPFRERERVSYGLGSYNGRATQSVTYSNQQDPNRSWNLSARYDETDTAYVSATYNHIASAADASLGLSWQQDAYSYVNGSLRGGITATRHGIAAHQKGINGGTRIMVDSGGIAGVPFSDGSVITNRQGVAVLAGTSSYYDVATRIDVRNLPEDIEANTTIVQGTLTEGAIGYRKFDVVSGGKVLGVVALQDGRYPPFASTVRNGGGREVAMVTDGGQVYLTGVAANEKLSLLWGGKAQCQIVLPAQFNRFDQLLLPCRPLTAGRELNGEE